MKTSAQLVFVVGLLTMLACTSGRAMSNTAPVRAGSAACARVRWFPRFSPAQLTNVPGLYFVPGLQGYQQTEEHTCGPAALMSLARFHGVTNIWVVVVGYDTRGNDDPWDDVLIFADSFDRYDDCPDGYTFVNANRFYWLWFDAFYFDTLTWRTLLTVTPRRASTQP
jgi:hypothetical protein